MPVSYDGVPTGFAVPSEQRADNQVPHAADARSENCAVLRATKPDASAEVNGNDCQRSDVTCVIPVSPSPPRNFRGGKAAPACEQLLFRKRRKPEADCEHALDACFAVGLRGRARALRRNAVLVNTQPRPAPSTSPPRPTVTTPPPLLH